MKYLEVGDVIYLKSGNKVYTAMPEKFAYSNRKVSDELCGNEYVIGETLRNDVDISKSINHAVEGIVERLRWEGFSIEVDKIRQFVLSNIPEPKADAFLIEPGEFVVIDTAFTGGGTGMGPHDTYPNGHEVTCKRLVGGEYDANGVEVSFYQSGCFTAMIKDIEPLRKMEMRFI